MEEIMNEFENEVKVLLTIADKMGAEIIKSTDGKVHSIDFDPFSLLRFADFLVSSTLDNYEELQNTKEV